MKKIISGLGVGLGLCLLMTSSVFAAALNWSADQNVSVGSNTLVVKTGSVATTFVVNTSNVVVTIPVSSSFTVTSSTGSLSQTGLTSGGSSSATCSGGLSQLTLTAGSGGTETVTITASGSPCTGVSGGGGGLPSGAMNAPTAPAGGFKLSINNDASSTNTAAVTLSITAGSDATKMSISNDANFTNAVQENFSATKQWTLCTTCTPGTYTVYAKVYTSYGQPSSVFSDTIGYQTGTSTTPNPTPTPTPTPAPTIPGLPNTGSGSSFPSNTLINDHGTIYFITKLSKIPFTSMKAFTGLGYSTKNVIKGDSSNISLAANYVLSSSTQAHPFGSWILSGKTVYYVSDAGLIPVSSWNVFLGNGGLSKYLVKANKADLSKPTLEVMQLNDARVSY